MKTRRLSVPAAAVFALVLAACSQLETRESPQLSPQLGLPNTDPYSNISVAVNQAGQIYTYSKSSTFERVPEGYEYIQALTTSRYNRYGTLIWEDPPSPSEDGCVADFHYDSCGESRPLDTGVDNDGNAYTLTYSSYKTSYECMTYNSASVTQLNKTRAYVWG